VAQNVFSANLGFLYSDAIMQPSVFTANLGFLYSDATFCVLEEINRS